MVAASSRVSVRRPSYGPPDSPLTSSGSHRLRRRSGAAWGGGPAWTCFAAAEALPRGRSDDCSMAPLPPAASPWATAWALR